MNDKKTKKKYVELTIIEKGLLGSASFYFAEDESSYYHAKSEEIKEINPNITLRIGDLYIIEVFEDKIQKIEREIVHIDILALEVVKVEEIVLLTGRGSRQVRYILYDHRNRETYKTLFNHYLPPITCKVGDHLLVSVRFYDNPRFSVIDEVYGVIKDESGFNRYLKDETCDKPQKHTNLFLKILIWGGSVLYCIGSILFFYLIFLQQ